MSVLKKIVEHKKKEVDQGKSQYPIKLLEQSKWFASPAESLKKHLRQKDKSGIIAEFKRMSPSKGVINDSVSVGQVSAGYVQAGASALSILTDHNFFGGSNEDLREARKINQCPILRKDFTIDEYQVIEAKSTGADAILLIAAILEPQQVRQLTDVAHSIGLEVLLEVHSVEELYPHLFTPVDLIGVNNRNLNTFEVNPDTSKKIAPFIPEEVIKISESGISNPKTIVELKSYGFEGFLIGENFMKHIQPELAAKEFINKLGSLQ